MGDGRRRGPSVGIDDRYPICVAVVQRREIVNLLKATPSDQPSPLPDSASDTSPLVMACAEALFRALGNPPAPTPDANAVDCLPLLLDLYDRISV